MKFSRIISVVVLVAALGLKIINPPILQQLQLATFDSFQRQMPRAYSQQPVRIIDIDDESLAKIGQWPWPRTQLAELINKLHEAGAAAVGMDIVFAEPDRTSPAQVAKLWPDKSKIVADAINSMPDNDKVFATAIADANVVTGFVLVPDKTAAIPVRKAGFSYAGDNPAPYALPFSGAVISLPELQNAALGNGALNSSPDIDGVLRHVPLFYRMGENLYPSLAAELLRVAQGASTYMIKAVGASGEESFGGSGGFTAVKVGDFEVPTDYQGKLWVHYTNYVPERYIPAWKILAGDFDKSLVEGNIILIGTSAAGLKDIRSTPLNPVTSGVEVHAQILEQILDGRFLKRPDWTQGAEILFLLVFGVVMIVLLAKTGVLGGAVGALIVAVIAVGVSWQAFSEYGLLLDPVYPTTTILLVYLSGSISRYMTIEKEKNQVRKAFSQYMSPALLAELAAHPDSLRLGGETRNMTVMFSDVRGFTTISEQLNAEELTRFMNRYLTPMTDVILSHRGTIDKYMGDAIMAFWNAPLPEPEHAVMAARAALDMMKALKELNESRKQEAEKTGRNYVPIDIGIGINTGDCCVGNMGSDQRFDYSVLGDDVNLASRLEGQSKTYGVNIIIGENSRARNLDMAMVELDIIKVKGKNLPVTIYALLGDETVAAGDEFKKMQSEISAMLAAYRRADFATAATKLNDCRIADVFGLDGLWKLYSGRIEHYTSNPPPEGWDGVYKAETK